nr:PREDICTED: malonyl-coenzyme A:anthocyanin 3-O-glucoside-6''-O-malonyltransferase-like [Daucus carota subsp. sativus]
MANIAAGINTVTILEHHRVSPPLDPSMTVKLLPLTFFDMMWLTLPPFSLVYFYDFPCSTSHLLETLVPPLKKSLTLALKYYFPLCGNLIIPTTLTSNTTPAIRYSKHDSVSLTIAEFSGATSQGFEHLSGNHPRDVDELFALVPQLPRGDTESVEDDSVLVSPVLSIQVTLFPDHGFSIGFTNSHVAADGKSLSNFIRTWASINAKHLIGVCNYEILDTLPFYDRNVIKDPKGIASNFFKVQHENSGAISYAAPNNKDWVQSTFVMNIAQIQAEADLRRGKRGQIRHWIQGLKNLVMDKIPHVSTFMVACAYLWTCMAKTREALGHETEVEQHLLFGMDARARLDPPIPANYFGNVVLVCWNTLKTRQLVGEDGFCNAVQEMKKFLDEKINSDEGVLKGLETYFDDIEAAKWQTTLAVAGSPKFDCYTTDFGWGKPKKYEYVFRTYACGLSGSRDSKGGLEIGLCLSKTEMNTFSTIFIQGLIN